MTQEIGQEIGHRIDEIGAGAPREEFHSREEPYARTRMVQNPGPARPVLDKLIAAAGKTPIDNLLDERQTTHGEFAETAMIAQAIKTALRAGPNWSMMTAAQRETLEGIATKQARIVCGDANFQDHWDDIAGWALKAVENTS
jgi:hypothetical protein